MTEVSKGYGAVPKFSGAYVMTFSIFDDVKGKVVREVTMSADQLRSDIASTSAAEKTRLPLLKLAKFGEARSQAGSLRHDKNVIEVTGVEVEYDGEQVSVEAAIDRLKSEGIGAIIYTSPSHTPEEPRWRVLAPLSMPLPPTERAKLATTNAKGETRTRIKLADKKGALLDLGRHLGLFNEKALPALDVEARSHLTIEEKRRDPRSVALALFSVLRETAREDLGVELEDLLTKPKVVDVTPAPAPEPQPRRRRAGGVVDAWREQYTGPAAAAPMSPQERARLEREQAYARMEERGFSPPDEDGN